LGVFLGLDSSEIRELYRLDGMLTVQPVQCNAGHHLLYHRQPRGDRMSEAPLAEAVIALRDYSIQEPA